MWCSVFGDRTRTGDAVGYGEKYVNGVDKGLRAIRWDAGSQTAIKLDVLGHDAQGGSYAVAHRINDRVLAIGVAHEYDGAGQYIGRSAVYWEPDGTVMKLDDLLEPGTGWLALSEVRSINDENWVIGTGLYDPDGPGPLDPYDRPFLLLIPEPISLLMVVCGASMVSARRRRDR